MGSYQSRAEVDDEHAILNGNDSAETVPIVSHLVCTAYCSAGGSVTAGLLKGLVGRERRDVARSGFISSSMQHACRMPLVPGRPA